MAPVSNDATPNGQSSGSGPAAPPTAGQVLRPHLAKHRSIDEDFNAFSASARSLALVEGGGGSSSRSLGLSGSQLGLSGRSWETAGQEQQHQSSALSFETARTGGPADVAQAAAGEPAPAAADAGASSATDGPDDGGAGTDVDGGGETGATKTAGTGSVAAEPETGKKKRYVTPKDFELLKVIGMGAFGKVLQVRNRASGEVLAMKVISKRLLRRKATYIENVQAERDILTKCQHPFVVTMHCSFQTKEKVFIVMDFLAGGELFLRLGREGHFLERTAAFYIGEIVLALEHLHARGILHRDLKPENILLSTDGHLCVTDFGLAKDFSTEDGWSDSDDNGGGGGKARTVCGTQEYMAPEMVARKGYGKAADFWSLGCISYEMLAGRPPFESKKGSKDLFQKIMNQRVKMPDGSSASACRLLKGLLNRNAQSRLGAARGDMFHVGGVAGLKQMDFFNGLDWAKLEKKEIDPPESLDVDHDEDLRHFHDEFTNMTLPRSVTEMNKPDFRPRHCDSDMFRGFSFVHDDFALPERPDNEDEDYWNNIDSDGQSMSGCSSAFGDNASEGMSAAEQPPLPPVVEKKKRPPRKRKKKKTAEATADSTREEEPTESDMSTKLAPVADQQQNEIAVDSAKKSAERKPTATSEKQRGLSKPATKPTPQSSLTKARDQASPAAGRDIKPTANPNPPAKKLSEKWETVKKGPQQVVKQGVQTPTANRVVNSNSSRHSGLQAKPNPSVDWQQSGPAVSGSATRAPLGSQATWAGRMAQASVGGQSVPLRPGAGRSNFAGTPAAMSNQSNRGTSLNGSKGTMTDVANQSDWRCHSMQSPGKNSPYKKKPPPQAGDGWPSLGDFPAPPFSVSGSESNVDPVPRKSPSHGSWAAKTSMNQTHPSQQRATKR